jgi:hypothetical protein
MGSLFSSNGNNRLNSCDEKIWQPLEYYKISNFSTGSDSFLLNESDERVKDNLFKKIYLELTKLREGKICKTLHIICIYR